VDFLYEPTSGCCAGVTWRRLLRGLLRRLRRLLRRGFSRQPWLAFLAAVFTLFFVTAFLDGLFGKPSWRLSPRAVRPAVLTGFWGGFFGFCAGSPCRTVRSPGISCAFSWTYAFPFVAFPAAQYFEFYGVCPEPIPPVGGLALCQICRPRSMVTRDSTQKPVLMLSNVAARGGAVRGVLV